MPTLAPTVTPYYGGGQVVNPANVIQTSGAPPTTFTQDKIGTLAVDNAAGNIYGLASKSGGLDAWVLLGGTTGAISAVNGTANQITAGTVGNIVTLSLPVAIITPGSLTTTTSLSSTTTITGGTGITATTGNIAASAGNVSASGTVTGGTGVIATTGNVAASAGNVTASGTVTGGTGVIATTGNITATAGQVIAGGDAAGVASTTSLTNTTSSTISTGVGSVKMSTTNPATNDSWIKIYIGTVAHWIPAWTTNAP